MKSGFVGHGTRRLCLRPLIWLIMVSIPSSCISRLCASLHGIHVMYVPQSLKHGQCSATNLRSPSSPHSSSMSSRCHSVGALSLVLSRALYFVRMSSLAHLKQTPAGEPWISRSSGMPWSLHVVPAHRTHCRASLALIHSPPKQHSVCMILLGRYG